MTGTELRPNRQPDRPRTVVTAVLAVLGVGCAVAAGPVYRIGVVPGTFPSYVPGAAPYQVDRFAGPWVAAGLLLAAAALVVLIVVIARLARVRRGAAR